MGDAAGNGGLVGGAEHLLGNGGASACRVFAAVEDAVVGPARGDMVAAAGIGAGRMAGNDIVDFEPVLDRAETLFNAAAACHLLLLILISNGNAEQRRGIFAQNGVLLPLRYFLRAADIFQRLLL